MLAFGAPGAWRVSLLIGVLALASSARAEPLPVDLKWDAPVECPSREEVMAELSRITRVKAGRIVTPISAQAKIERTSAGRYTLRLRTQREDQTGDTDLDAATCAVLKRGVTLVLALALGDGVDLIDEREAPPAPPPAAPLPVTPPSAAPKPKAAPTPKLPPAAPPPATRVTPWLAGTASSGLLGKPAFGAQLGLALGQTHWDALAHASLWPARSAASVAGVGASFFAFIGAVGGCGRYPFGGWSIAGCAAFQVGLVHARSVGAFQDASATAPYYAALPSVVLTTPLSGRARLRFEGALGIDLDPPHFALRYFSEVYAVARYVPTFSIGLAFDGARTGAE